MYLARNMHVQFQFQEVYVVDLLQHNTLLIALYEKNCRSSKRSTIKRISLIWNVTHLTVSMSIMSNSSSALMWNPWWMFSHDEKKTF